jgi:hypothetical protein
MGRARGTDDSHRPRARATLAPRSPPHYARTRAAPATQPAVGREPLSLLSAG